jgi:hypothetical protein
MQSRIRWPSPKGSPMQTIDIVWLFVSFGLVYIPYLLNPKINELPVTHGIPAECITEDWY